MKQYSLILLNIRPLAQDRSCRNPGQRHILKKKIIILRTCHIFCQQRKEHTLFIKCYYISIQVVFVIFTIQMYFNRPCNMEVYSYQWKFFSEVY